MKLQELSEMFGPGFSNCSVGELTDEGLMNRVANNVKFDVPCLDCDNPIEVVNEIKHGMGVTRCSSCGEIQDIPKMIRQHYSNEDDNGLSNGNEMTGGQK